MPQYNLPRRTSRFATNLISFPLHTILHDTYVCRDQQAKESVQPQRLPLLLMQEVLKSNLLKEIKTPDVRFLRYGAAEPGRGIVGFGLATPLRTFSRMRCIDDFQLAPLAGP